MVRTFNTRNPMSLRRGRGFGGRLSMHMLNQIEPAVDGTNQKNLDDVVSKLSALRIKNPKNRFGMKKKNSEYISI